MPPSRGLEDSIIALFHLEDSVLHSTLGAFLAANNHSLRNSIIAATISIPLHCSFGDIDGDVVERNACNESLVC